MIEAEGLVRNFEIFKLIQDYTDKIESGKIIIEWDTNIQNMKFDALRNWNSPSTSLVLGLFQKTFSLEDDKDKDQRSSTRLYGENGIAIIIS